MKPSDRPAVFIPLAQVGHAPANAGWAPFALGFRPFYLLAALWMVVALPVWLAVWGHGYALGHHLGGMAWHGHEMLFGFTGAVIVGFLFTAVSNWTGLPTPRGRALAGIALVWLLARILLLTRWSVAGAVFDVAFYLLAAIGIGIPLLRSGNRRNQFFIAIMLVFAALAGVHHLAAGGWLAMDEGVISQQTLLLIMLIVTVIGGRVIPMFTQNAVPGVVVHRRLWTERLSIGGLVALWLLSWFGADSAAANVIAALTALVQLRRWLGWSPWATRHKPILWILHLSYLWLPLGLALRALPASWWPLAELLSTHALTVGVIAGLCIGMMTRTARGHTGRPLQADTPELWAYALVALAPVCRVLLPLAAPGFYQLSSSIAGVLLIAGFAVYLLRYLPWLLRTRADGRPG